MARGDARDHVYRNRLHADQPHDAYSCEMPIPVYGIGLPSGVLGETASPLPVEFSARCRKCPGCLRHRQRLWTARAIDETKASKRTWFCTLTVRPEDRFRMDLIAERYAMIRRLADEPPEEVFRLRAKIVGQEVTRWLKRVRKNSGAKLRVLLVTESHKDGYPHFHALIHETSGTVTKRVLEAGWRVGFSQFRLCDPGASGYVAKYLSKVALTRVRASRHYGQPTLVSALTERVEKATRACQNGSADTPRLSSGSSLLGKPEAQQTFMDPRTSGNDFC